MFRGIVIIHAQDRESLDRELERVRAELRTAPGAGERWTWLSAASVENEAYCAREALIFKAAGDGRNHAAADVAGHREQLPRALH